MELGDRHRLAMKTPAGVDLPRQKLVEDFDRDEPRQLSITRAINDAHAALAELAQDLVSFELRTAQISPHPNSIPSRRPDSISSPAGSINFCLPTASSIGTLSIAIPRSATMRPHCPSSARLIAAIPNL